MPAAAGSVARCSRRWSRPRRPNGIWTIQTSIIDANGPSLRLHEAAGFRVVGRRERIGQRDGVWRDTLLLELRLP